MLYPLSYEGSAWTLARPHPHPPRCSGAEDRKYDPAMAEPSSAPTVLVVDDDPVVLRLLGVTFEMEGFAVLTASDGREAIATATTARPDAVITDIMMPKLDGLRVLAELKADERTATTPVVLLSARAQTADVRKGLDAGADDYVTKPFEPFDLIDLINQLLGR